MVDVLDVEWRHAACHEVAGAEAYVAHDAVRRQFHLVAGDADAATGGRLSGNGDVALAGEA